jgi:hypothetical protein
VARLRLNETVYPVTLTRVTDPAEMERSWDARAQKLARLEDPTATVPDTSPDEDWWTFRVVSR